ncbi:MAG TPA: DUF6325 family protein [Capillimicrobium sp.]|nr:DUF6325 family protein [Capillimicrobium sp.]
MSGVGPVQLLLVGFEPDAPLKGEILAELERLAERDIIRVLDILVVRKEDDGRIAIVEANEDGVAVALTGLHDESAEPAPVPALDVDDPDVWYVADEIPAGATAAVALIEHRWALGLKQAMQGAGGHLLAEEWIHPLDLQAVGLDA